MFANYEVEVKPLLGAAQSLGWKMDYRSLVNIRHGHVFYFDLGCKLYPGIDVATTTGDLVSGANGASLESAPPRVLSEVLREVDLLVAVGTRALSPSPNATSEAFSPGTMSTQMRKEAVARLFAQEVAAGRIVIEGHHVVVDGYRLHLGTLRLTRRGDPVEVPLDEATSWLPYEDTDLLAAVQSLNLALSEGSAHGTP